MSVTFNFETKRNIASRPVFAKILSSNTGQLALFRYKVTGCVGHPALTKSTTAFNENAEHVAAV